MTACNLLYIFYTVVTLLLSIELRRWPIVCCLVVGGFAVLHDIIGVAAKQAENASPRPANIHPLDAHHSPNYAGQTPTILAAQIHAIEDICYVITLF